MGSLADIYRENFGEPQAAEEDNGMTKEAADMQLEAALESLTEDECEKLAQVIEVLDSEGFEFDHDLQKIAAAAEIVDSHEEYMEKEAAEEIIASGRLFARGFAHELENL